MGVYIVGLNKPENEKDCNFYEEVFMRPFPYCHLIHKSCAGLEHCPIIEIREPHGRLIDADALHKLFEDQWHYLQVLDWNENPTAEANQSGINWCINTMHDDAPTVIPASESKERPAFLPQYELTPRSEEG